MTNVRPEKPKAPKRFYETAEAVPHEDGFAVALDGRIARSPGRRPLAGSEALAQAMAAEWDGQGEQLDMAAMPLTALHGRFLDADEETRAAWTTTVRSYANTDLLCYRAEDPALAKRQAETWQPPLDRVGDRLGETFVVTEGVIAVAQPSGLGDAIDAFLAERSEEARYGAALLTEITGSAVLALDILMGAEPDFAASRVDERFQEERWGEDAEAKAREASLERDFAAVVDYWKLT